MYDQDDLDAVLQQSFSQMMRAQRIDDDTIRSHRRDLLSLDDGEGDGDADVEVKEALHTNQTIRSLRDYMEITPAMEERIGRFLDKNAEWREWIGGMVLAASVAMADGEQVIRGGYRGCVMGREVMVERESEGGYERLGSIPMDVAKVLAYGRLQARAGELEDELPFLDAEADFDDFKKSLVGSSTLTMDNNLAHAGPGSRTPAGMPQEDHTLSIETTFDTELVVGDSVMMDLMAEKARHRMEEKAEETDEDKDGEAVSR